MLKAILRSRIDAADRRLGVSSDYLKYMLQTSLTGFLKFAKVFAPSAYRAKLPAGVYHAARIVATQDADCGPCVQIVVNLALADGISAETLRAVLDREYSRLAPELVEVVQFTEHVVRGTYEEEALRSSLKQRYGDAGLVELAIAISMVRVYPIAKRVLGYAASCEKVKVVLPTTTAG